MAGKWRVTSQRQTEQLTAGGTFESVVRVNFQLASGTNGFIEVPSRLYTEDYVRGLIEEKATAMAGVEGLQG